jgi:hypothetical protein
LSSVKVIRINKEKIRKRYRQLSSTSEVNLARAAIENSLKQLVSQTRHLDIDAYRDGSTKRQLVRQVNQLVFADLLSVLSAALRVHAEAELDDYESMLWDLDCWIQIAGSTVDLYKKSTSERWNKVKLYGVKDIRNKMLVPLSKVLDAFKRERRNLENSYDRQMRRTEALVATQRRKDAEKADELLTREYDDKYRRLRGLFVYRIAASRVKNPAHSKFRMYGKTLEEWKQEQQPFDGAPELDSDGVPMERVPIFRERAPGRRPPTSTLWYEEEETEWTEDERYALLDALQTCHGMSHSEPHNKQNIQLTKR